MAACRGDDGSDDGDDGDGDGDADGDGSDGDAAGDENRLFAQWQQMQQQEAELLGRLKASQADELAEARQLKKQHTSWLRLLQLRLRLQPAMAAAMRWPAAAQSPLWASSAALRDEAAAAAEEVGGLIDDLCTLQRAYAQQWSGGGEAAGAAAEAAAAAAAREADGGADAPRWWAALEAAEAARRPWCDAEVARTEERAQSGAAAAAAATKFKVVNQGVLQQVSHLLAQLPAGSEARAQRCHRANARVLGMGAAAPAAAAAAADDDDGDGDGEEVEGELYDDADFYHSLLKELLDDGGGALAASGAPKLKHRKKKTDNRRSKGRRLSYEPMPKLQNFMFPEIPERPIVLSELFGSVFGARIAPDGGADAAAAAAPAADDGPALGGVSLFGDAVAAAAPRVRARAGAAPPADEEGDLNFEISTTSARDRPDLFTLLVHS